MKNVLKVFGLIEEKIMVNKRNGLGILVLVLIFGMMAVDSTFGQDRTLNGKWMSPESRGGGFENDEFCEFTFLAGNYEIRSCVGLQGGYRDSYRRPIIIPFEKGTYTTNDKGVIFLKPTHYYFQEIEKWYTKDEFIKLLKSEGGMTDAEIKEAFENEGVFIDRSFVYSISSAFGLQELALYIDGKKFTYKKQ